MQKFKDGPIFMCFNLVLPVLLLLKIGGYRFTALFCSNLLALFEQKDLSLTVHFETPTTFLLYEVFWDDYEW